MVALVASMRKILVLCRAVLASEDYDPSHANTTHPVEI